MQRIQFIFFFSSRRRHTRSLRDWSSDVCSSDLAPDGTADPDWADRIAAHRERRPRGWTTAEGADVAGHIRNKSSGVLLVDGIGVWLAGVLDECGAGEQAPDGSGGRAGGSATAAKCVDAAVDELILSLRPSRSRLSWS